MAVYNLFDLLGRITEIINDGYFYADISEIPSDDEFPQSLSFSALGSDDAPEYDCVDSISYDYENPPEFPVVSKDAPFCALSLSELETTLHAVNNALEYFKECSLNKDGLYDRSTLDDLKRSSVKLRNFQSKLIKFLGHK